MGCDSEVVYCRHKGKRLYIFSYPPISQVMGASGTTYRHCVCSGGRGSARRGDDVSCPSRACSSADTFWLTQQFQNRVWSEQAFLSFIPHLSSRALPARGRAEASQKLGGGEVHEWTLSQTHIFLVSGGHSPSSMAAFKRAHRHHSRNNVPWAWHGLHGRPVPLPQFFTMLWISPFVFTHCSDVE